MKFLNNVGRWSYQKNAILVVVVVVMLVSLGVSAWLSGRGGTDHLNLDQSDLPQEWLGYPENNSDESFEKIMEPWGQAEEQQTPFSTEKLIQADSWRDDSSQIRQVIESLIAITYKDDEKVEDPSQDSGQLVESGLVEAGLGVLRFALAAQNQQVPGDWTYQSILDQPESNLELGVYQSFYEAFEDGLESQTVGSSQRLLGLAESKDINQQSLDLKPSRLAGWAYASGLIMDEQNAQAARWYEQDALEYQDEKSAYQAIDLYQQAGLGRELIRLDRDAVFAPFIQLSYLQYELASQGDWQAAISVLPAAWWEDLSESQWPAVVLALVSGFFWWAFIVSFAKPGQAWKKCLILSLAGLLLGALSARLTLLWIGFQEGLWGFDYDPAYDNMARGVLYCVVGIGLREEFLKLLCVLPLVYWVYQSTDIRQALLVAGSVGLGFAIEENMGYYEASSGMPAAGRFLTANFFHITLTATAGFAMIQAFSTRGKQIEYAIQAFGIAVIAHGVYDAFLSVTSLMEYSLFAIMVFILLAYQYFHLLRQVQPTGRRLVSLTSIFAVGLAVTCGGSLMYMSYWSGLFDAFMALGSGFLGVAVICVMYFREIPEQLT